VARTQQAALSEITAVLPSPPGVLPLTERRARAQPALLIPLSGLGSVEFARAAGTSSTFDLVLHARDGAAHEARIHRCFVRAGAVFPVHPVSASTSLTLLCCMCACWVRRNTLRVACRQAERFLCSRRLPSAHLVSNTWGTTPSSRCARSARDVMEILLTGVLMACACERWRLVALGGARPAGCRHPVSAAGRGAQFTSIPRAELTGLAAYVAERRLPVGAADVAAAAAARAHDAVRSPAGEDDEDSEEARAPACTASRSALKQHRSRQAACLAGACVSMAEGQRLAVLQQVWGARNCSLAEHGCTAAPSGRADAGGRMH